MRSIVSYQRDKEKRSSSVRSGDIPYAAKKPKVSKQNMDNCHVAIYSTLKMYNVMYDNIMQLTEKQPTITSKIPKATFKPSVMTVNHTSFNFTDKKSMKSNTANAGKDTLQFEMYCSSYMHPRHPYYGDTCMCH